MTNTDFVEKTRMIQQIPEAYAGYIISHYRMLKYAEQQRCKKRQLIYTLHQQMCLNNNDYI